MDYVGQVWYQTRTYELKDGWWHPIKKYSSGIGHCPDLERRHIFRGVGYGGDGTRTTYFRVYPKNSREFSSYINYDGKIYQDGEHNMFF